jgi:hypothetical protein
MNGDPSPQTMPLRGPYRIFSLTVASFFKSLFQTQFYLHFVQPPVGPLLGGSNRMIGATAFLCIIRQKIRGEVTGMRVWTRWDESLPRFPQRRFGPTSCLAMIRSESRYIPVPGLFGHNLQAFARTVNFRVARSARHRQRRPHLRPPTTRFVRAKRAALTRARDRSACLSCRQSIKAKSPSAIRTC